MAGSVRDKIGRFSRRKGRGRPSKGPTAAINMNVREPVFAALQSFVGKRKKVVRNQTLAVEMAIMFFVQRFEGDPRGLEAFRREFLGNNQTVIPFNRVA